MKNQTDRWLDGTKLALVLLAAALFVRLPGLFCGFYNPDETCYAAIGQRLLEGKFLYLQIIDHKPPLIYYLYALFVFIGGNKAILVAHAAMIAIVAATAYAICHIADFLNVIASPKGEAIPLSPGDCFVAAAPRNDSHVGLLAAILYIVGTSLGKPNDVAAANAELFFNLPLTLSLLFAIVSLDRKKLRFIAASGAFAGIAVLIKPQAAVAPAATGFFLLFASGLAIRQRLKSAAAFAAFLSLPLGLAAFFLSANGSLSAAWYWGVTVNSLYMEGHEGGAVMALRFFKQSLYMFSEEFALWIPLILWPFLKNRGDRIISGNGRLIAIWLAASALAVVPGFRFYGHYYLQMLPPLSILSACAALKLLSAAKAKRALVASWCAVIAIPLVYSWIWATPLIGKGLEPEENAGLISYLKEATRPGEKIEVWGRFNGIPFLAGRENGTRFLNKNLLSGSFRRKKLVRMPDAHWDMFFADIEKNKPEWFVDHSGVDMKDAPINLFPKLADYIESHYTLKAEVNGSTVYRRNR
ncbi:MAG: hypothetical protein V2A66_07970 [Pseudomonadota bacterium]